MKKRTIVYGAVVLGVCAVLVGVWLWTRESTVVGPARTVTVSLYFGLASNETLVTETRVVEVVDETVDIGKVIELLLEGPRDPRYVRVIPQGVRLLDWHLEGKVAVLNFSRELAERHPGGSFAELQTVFSIVNTVTSIPGVEAVRILVEGEEVESLAGHVDLTEPLDYSPELVQPSQGQSAE